MRKASLVAKQIRLQQWADDIRACNQRPEGTTVDDWCRQHGLRKATYYWRLRAVREACIDIIDSNVVESSVEATQNFVELQPTKSPDASEGSAVIKLGKASIEISENISDMFLLRIMEAVSNA